MNSMTIFRQITIKQIVTEASKAEAFAQMKAEIETVIAEQKQFEDEKNKILTEASLKGADQAQIAKFRQHFETDGARYHVRQDELRVRGEEVSNMVVGEEIVIGSVEGPFDLQIGQTLNDALSSEIVLKDGVVVEIR